MKPSIMRFEKSNEPQKKRQRALTQDDVSRIRVGDRYDYRGRGSTTFGALYSAEVLDVHTHTITLWITIDQASAPIGRYGAARGYRIALQKSEIGRSERLYKPLEWGN